MNTAVTRAFFIPRIRQQMLEVWLERYGRQGVGLCTHTLRLIAYIRPDGTLHELKPPFQQFQMWQMANAPKVHSTAGQTCACANYYDPEVQGPWKERGLPPNHHHPFCQFSKTAVAVYQDAWVSAAHRVANKLTPQERPDEWVRRQQMAEGKRGEKTRF